MLSSILALISLQCLLHMTSSQSAKTTPTPPSQEPLALPRAFVMRPPSASYWGQISWRRGSVLPAATGGRQRRKRATSMTAATTNTSTGVSEFTSGGYWGWAMAEIATQQQLWRRGGRIVSYPTDYGDAGAGSKATFGRYPVCIGGFLVQCGWRKWTITAMTTRDGPPNDDEKAGNVGKLWARRCFFSN